MLSYMKACNTYLLSIFLLLPFIAISQVPKPEDELGFKPGADYKIADYTQTTAYFKKVAVVSQRVKLVRIGQSSMGKPMWLMFVSSAKNLKKLEQWRTTSEKLARAKINETEAKKLAKSGKTVVWIDAGMHATEAAGAQMMPELLYRLATEETDEMKHIRENVIILLCPTLNPDGQDIVASWYKQQLGTPWEITAPPVLYQKYVGHDNNRDWFMNNMLETRNVTEILYNQWYPQIVHNHHQTSPSWARIFLPPFRSPVNPRIHPGVTTGVNLMGTAMANYFAMKKMPGVISGVSFSMWWNGGMRTVPYYHNMIGLLTETGHRTPSPRFYPPDSIPEKVGGKSSDGSEIFYPYPWKGGESHFRDAIDYMINASLGVLNLAADRREKYLYNIYDMGRDAIEDVSEESAFAYVIPGEQWDRGEAANLINILKYGGVEVHQATADFHAGDSTYRKGDFIIYGAQAFRPYLEDLLEKQTYPDQYRYPGGPPVPPYDLTGWTLPMQMAVEVHRVDTTFTAQARLVKGEYRLAEGKIPNDVGYGYILSNHENLSALAVNRILNRGGKVAIATDSSEHILPGYFIIENGNETRAVLEEVAKTTGLIFRGINTKPAVNVKYLSSIKLGIYKSWMANMDEGWTRWVLEQFEFDLDTLHNKDIQTADLSVYDAIIIPSQRANSILHGYSEGFMPPRFTGGIELEGTIALDNYVRQGGVLIGFDAASDYLIEQFGLPVRNITSGLSSSKFFIPGSLVKIVVDTSHPLGYGMQNEAAAYFIRSRAFKRVIKQRKGEGGNEDTKPAPEPDVDTPAKYAEKDILMSGWAKGQNKYLKNNGALMDVKWGKGHVVLFGFRPQFRGQPRGTYKLIFNAIYMGAVE